MLTARAIGKKFGRIVALDNVEFTALPGEIHALVGENGAGKSTLVSIITGRLRPDSGQVALDGETAGGPSQTAPRRVIAAVYQSPMLFERMSWEENLALGGIAADRFGLDLEQVRKRADEIAVRAGLALPSAGVLVEDTSIPQRVRLEIVRALSLDPRVLILDEPTGVLSGAELVAFLQILQRLRDAGRIVVIVSHKLPEVMAVADRITVLRHGRRVAVRERTATNEAELARLMIGEIPEEARKTPSRRPGQEIVLRAEHLTFERDGRIIVNDVALNLRAGEIAGIAGVDGNGQTELVELLAGVRQPSAGRIELTEGTDRHSISIIPQNRDADGLILDMPLWENLLLPAAIRRRFSPGWQLLNTTAARQSCADLMRRFRMRAASPSAGAASLSGGNRQRLVVARALACEPRVIVAHDICRGLDLRAAAELHRILREYAESGGAVLLISSDLDELLSVCGRLLVMNRGVLAELPENERNPERLGLMMAGAAQ